MVVENYAEHAEALTKGTLLLKSAFRQAQCPIFLNTLTILIPKQSPPDQYELNFKRQLFGPSLLANRIISIIMFNTLYMIQKFIITSRSDSETNNIYSKYVLLTEKPGTTKILYLRTDQQGIVAN